MVMEPALEVVVINDATRGEEVKTTGDDADGNESVEDGWESKLQRGNAIGSDSYKGEQERTIL